MCLLDRLEVEVTRVEARHDLAGLHQLCCLAQDFYVMRASFSGQHRQKREHPRIARSSKRQRSQGMRAPAECAHDMSKACHGVKGGIESGSSLRVLDDV